jgi:hypothetical protein
MASYKFRDFCEVKQFVTLCGHHKIEVEPFVQKLKSIAENVELSEQERYDELLQAAKNAASLVGNKISQGAGAAARGIGQAVGAGWGVLQNGANNIQKGFAAGQALANGMGAPGAANVAGQQQNSGMPNPNQPNATVAQNGQQGQQGQQQGGVSPKVTQQVQQLQQTLQGANQTLQGIMKAIQGK